MLYTKMLFFRSNLTILRIYSRTHTLSDHVQRKNPAVDSNHINENESGKKLYFQDSGFFKLNLKSADKQIRND